MAIVSPPSPPASHALRDWRTHSYPRTCEYIMASFRCHELADGREFLIADFTIQCTVAYKVMMWPFGIFCIGAWAMGVPVMLFRRLRIYKDALFDPNGARNVMGRPCEPLPAPMWQLGFLYKSYRPGCYWFECIELIKKYFMCAVLPFIKPGSASQIVGAMFFLTMYLAVLAYLAPYAESGDNYFSYMCHIEVCAHL